MTLVTVQIPYPTFSGSAAEDIKTFRYELRVRKKLEKWSAVDEAANVVSCLKEPALRFIFEKPDEEWDTFDKVMDLLEMEYADKISETEALELITSAKQIEEESIEKYASRFEGLLVVAPHLPENVSVTLFVNLFSIVSSAHIFLIKNRKL